MDSRLSLEGMMTPAPYCIHPDTNVVEAKKEMEHRNVRHLPVRDGDTILGILSQRDVALSLSLAKHITDEASIRVADVCGSDPYIIDAEERLDVVLNYMATHRIGSCLVTKNDELVGIITTTDICRVCGDFLKDFFDQLKDS